MGATAVVRRLLLSHALASVAMSMPWPLLLVLVWNRFDGTSYAGLALGVAGAARMLPYVLFSWAGGLLADRVRRDRLVRATLVARTVLLAAAGIAVHHEQVTTAVVLAAATVACGTPAYPALAAAMPAVAGEGRRRATDLLVTIEVAAFVVGPAIGGVLLVPFIRPWLPVVSLAAMVLALVCMVGVQLPAVPRVALPAGTGTMLDSLRSSSVATRAVATAGVLNGVDAALALTLLPLAARVWGGAADYGWAAGALGFGALGAPLLWWLAGSSATRARRALLLLAASLALVPLAPAMLWALLPLAVFGAAQVQVESAVTEAIQDEIPDEHRAAALGLTDSVMVGAALVGSLLAPWLASQVGARPLVGVLALCCLATVALPRHTSRREPVAPRMPRQRTPSAVENAPRQPAESTRA